MSIIGRILNKASFETKRRKAAAVRKGKTGLVRWGIIGTGYMANTFTRALLLSENAEVVAAASRRIDKAKAFCGSYGIAKAYGSYEELVKDKDIDVIYIATPEKYHYEHIRLALENGRGVLCEKPVTSNPEQLTELIKLAKDNGLFLMEGMWTACLPVNKKASEWIRNGEIGEIKRLRIDLSKNELDARLKTAEQKAYNGVLMDYGIYTIAFAALFMKGEITVEHVECKRTENGIDKDWVIKLKDEAGAVADITISSEREGDRTAVIEGTEGSIGWNSQFNRTNTIRRYDGSGNKAEEYSVRYESEGFEYEVEEANSSLKSGRTESEAVPLEYSMKVQQIIYRLNSR